MGKTSRFVRAIVAGLLLIGLVPASSVQAATATKTVLYGPFSLPAGTQAVPAQISALRFAVPRPCIDCYITQFTPDLVYTDGSRATLDNGAMLHHAVFASQWHQDATCYNKPLGLAGERFFASGDERTVVKFPDGYGYRVRYYDSWTLLVDLMNHSSTPKDVYVKVTYNYRPSSDPVTRVRPVWLDIDECGDSEYSIPAAYSDTHWDWKVNVPGNVVSVIGHLHGHGLFIEATNESRGGQSICKSVATLDPTDVHRVLAMSTCVGDPVARIRQGDTVRLHSVYQSSHAASDVMGIMLAYVDPK